MSVLGELGTPVSLRTLADRMRTGKSIRGLIAVSFDDGYADNLTIAAPILKKNEVPATFFVVAGLLGETFWWDELVGLVLDSENLPARLRIAAGSVN